MLVFELFLEAIQDCGTTLTGIVGTIALIGMLVVQQSVKAHSM